MPCWVCTAVLKPKQCILIWRGKSPSCGRVSSHIHVRFPELEIPGQILLKVLDIYGVTWKGYNLKTVRGCLIPQRYGWRWRQAFFKHIFLRAAQPSTVGFNWQKYIVRMKGGMTVNKIQRRMLMLRSQLFSDFFHRTLFVQSRCIANCIQKRQHQRNVENSAKKKNGGNTLWQAC